MKGIKTINLQRVLTAFLVALVLINVAIQYTLPLEDSDIWFHLSYGQYFIQNKTLIPDHTLYSWTPTTNETVYCTWLSDILLYGIYSISGIKGLFALRYLSILFFVAGVGVFAFRRQILVHPLTWLICLLGVLMAKMGVSCKPEVFSFFFMTAIVWNWWHIKRNDTQSWINCYLFPLVMLLWANSHGGVVFGYIFLLLIGVSEILNAKFKLVALSKICRKHFFVSLGISFLVLFVTPYGWRYPWTLLQTVVPTSDNVTFQSYISCYENPFSLDGELLGFGDLANICLLVMLLTVIPLIRKKKIDFSFLLTNLVFSFVYTLYFRSTYYWVPVYVFSMLFMLSKEHDFLFSTYTKRTLTFLGVAVLSCFLTVSGGKDALCRPSSYNYFGLGIGENSPVDEAGYIKRFYPGYNIGNTYNQGAYLMWKLWPDNKIMIDARHFPYRAWSDQLFYFTLNPDKSDFLSRYQCDIWCVGLNFTDLALWFYNSEEWNLAYYGKNAAVFVRRGLPVHQVSEENKQHTFQSLRGYAASFYSFKFAVSIQDWKTTQTIIARMKDIYRCSEIRNFPVIATYFKEACQSFYNHDYKTTAELLSRKDVRQHLRRDGMLSLALLHLAENFWRNNDLRTTQTLLEKAVTAKATPYSLFNFGVVNGYISQHAQTLDIEPGNHWKTALNQFLALNHQGKNSTLLNDIARTMLQGRYQQRPPLFFPPSDKKIVSAHD